VRTANAWPAVLLVWALPIWIPELALAGRELFMRETPYLDAHPGATLVIAGFAFVEIAIGVWTVVVFLKCLGEAQGFSAWKALGNILIAFAVSVLVFIGASGVWFAYFRSSVVGVFASLSSPRGFTRRKAPKRRRSQEFYRSAQMKKGGAESETKIIR
jgi:hypothetical protein